MSSALLFMLLLSGLGIGGNIFSDARSAICFPDPCDLPRPHCLPGWTRYAGQCYLFRATATSWADAEGYCNRFGAHLTSIQGPDQYRFIRRLIEKATGTNTRTWVGGTNTDGDWTWIDGSPFTFTNWGPGEPNNAGGNEHCMDINLNGQDYVNDENCDTKSASICAKDF
ncbi:galactose-specific lectin nattectin [Austrofundulus limnaeus]|uniref:Galactose-specific lectin nattectin n=1 Tax=Austrofundulus limnaeus TaxID=52670 RepID=A0A2I4D9F1_AUSLI|nr:PREDICTED: galactose-specific lectin nattectin-like [Austrofundulus limnaeus]